MMNWMKKRLYLICGAPSGRKQNLIPIKAEGKERNNTFFFEIKTPSVIIPEDINVYTISYVFGI